MDAFGTYLEWISITVFRHLIDNSATITKLAHFTATPGVQAAFFTGMAAVILQEKLKIAFIAQVEHHLLLRVPTPLVIYHYILCLWFIEIPRF